MKPDHYKKNKQKSKKKMQHFNISKFHISNRFGIILVPFWVSFLVEILVPSLNKYNFLNQCNGCNCLVSTLRKRGVSPVGGLGFFTKLEVFSFRFFIHNISSISSVIDENLGPARSLRALELEMG